MKGISNLKNLIKNNIDIVEKSGEKARFSSFINVLLASGSSDAIPVGENDRRWLAPHIEKENENDSR